MIEIWKTAGLLHVLLAFGQYETGKDLYLELMALVEGMPHDDIVHLINRGGVADHRAGWIAKAWCEAHNFKAAELQFQTAGCFVDSVGDGFCYRRNKHSWGDLVAIRPQDFIPMRSKDRQLGDASSRMYFHLSPDNPIRLRQTTRNEVKLLLGKDFVNSAMWSNKGAFMAEIDPREAARIERFTGMPLGKLWGAIRKGDKDLVDRLQKIPNSKRDQMRKRGMYVAPHFEPQMTLF